MKNAVALPLILCLVVFNLKAGDSKLNRESLVGIKDMEVVIEALSPEETSAGLTSDQIRTDVEVRLRRVGIRIVESGEATRRTPLLYVKPVLLKRNGQYSYDVLVSVDQSVTVIANERFVLGSTWSLSTLGSAGANSVGRAVRGVISDLVDSFINAYLSVNPRP